MRIWHGVTWKLRLKFHSRQGGFIVKVVETDNYCRISKAQAKKLYEAGGQVFLLPCRMHPENAFQHPVPVRRQKCNAETGQLTVEDPSEFGVVVHAFELFNCDSARGWYTAFYRRK